MDAGGRPVVFGGPLGTHSATLVKNLLTYLGTASCLSNEGLFRLSPEAEETNMWVSKLETDPRADLSTISDPHLVAHLLKRYFRLLTPPLLTHDLYDAFVSAASACDETKICACVCALPPLNHALLSQLLNFLLVVLEHSDRNRMTLDGLATVFAPCLISKVAEGATASIQDVGRVSVQKSCCVLCGLFHLLIVPLVG
jgi:hypothetical protein